MHLKNDTFAKKVLNYSDTFFWDIPTNESYEGPNTKIKKIDSEKIEIYGVEALVNKYSFEVMVDDEKCASSISIQEQSNVFFFKRKRHTHLDSG